MYTFTKLDRHPGPLTSLIRPVCGWAAPLPEQILAIGRCRAMFGEPLTTGGDLEELFEYAIRAENLDGETVLLTLYFGSSGPSIGGLQDEASRQAADFLAAAIRRTEPVDIDLVLGYEDTGSRIRPGVREGTPYFIEESVN